MTLSLLPATDAGSPPATLPAGLTPADAARIAAAIASGQANSTRAVYASVWRRWERWCVARGIAPLPASPPTVCAYLAECASRDSRSPVSIKACAAIGYEHRWHGADDPIADELVRQVRRGLRRAVGTAPRRQARPLGPSDDVRWIVAGIDRDTAKAARDAALILLGFASAPRRSELAALTLADIEAKPAGLLLTRGWTTYLAFKGPSPNRACSTNAAKRCPSPRY